ncbi:MAG: hypothetical protein QOJ15_3463 [Bradyrhizobium sp.]|jgi:hypothetical protein|nr:hypothetical protein [Bradyrhizobium sp.]
MLTPCRSAASPHRIKIALEIDRDLPIEQRIVAVGDLCRLHDTRIVDEHIDPAERDAASNIPRTAAGALTSALTAAFGFDVAGKRLGGAALTEY